ncbi:MAG: TonB-dependent receptor plug domain-containing protein [Algicola sp.]|nr:TonB-dependent receptor plug domain-containing protein [Algicola sp.]
MLPSLAFSQEEAKFYVSFDREPVDCAFELIESIYDVRFSYKDIIFDNKTVTLNRQERSIITLLSELEAQLSVTFEWVDDRYIIVITNEASGRDITKVQELERIVVKSYLTQGIAKNSDGSYLIKPKELGILPGLTEPDVLESVQLLPGVMSPNETASGFLVRGGKVDQNRLIWDGINIYHKGHLFGMISPFNPNATKTVTFINKGSHPRYGERASSVISMATTTEVEDKVKAEVGANGISGDMYLEVPIIKEKLGIQGSVRSSYTDMYQSHTFNQLADKVFGGTKISHGDNPDNRFQFLDYNMKINFEPNPKHQFFASLISIDNNLDYTVRSSENNQTFNDRMTIDNNGYGLGWTAQWLPKWRQVTNVYFSKYKLQYNYVTSEAGDQISDFEKRNVIFDSGIATELQWKINDNNDLDMGYQYVLKDVGYAFLNTSNLSFILDTDKTVVQSQSIYGNYHFRKPESFEVSLGLRVTHFQELQSYKFEPRLLFYKSLLRHLKLQISGEIKHQIISEIDETVISDLSLENRLWRLSNGRKFPIIKSQQVSAGFIFTKRGWTIDMDSYYKTLDNITALSLGFLNPENSQFNIGNQRVYGADVFLKKRFHNINTWMGYTFNSSKSQYKNINNEDYFTSRSNVTHMLSTSLSCKWSDFQVALGWRWQTGKPFTPSSDATGNLEFNDGINTRRLPNYHRLDLSSTYKFRISRNSPIRAKVGFSIRNIYNKRNLISREYRGNNDLNSDIEMIERYSLGFTPNLMFRLYW